jgi:hypothetical protein
MYSEKIPAKEYAQLANQFNPVKFDAKAWMNVGPTAEGLIPQPCIDRLAEVGEWMDVNQEAIYGTMPWKVFHEGSPPGVAAAESTDIRFTSNGDSVYAICLTTLEKELVVKLMGKKEIAGRTIVSISILGSKDEVKWQQDDAGLTLPVPPQKPSISTNSHSKLHHEIKHCIHSRICGDAPPRACRNNPLSETGGH